jgi:hypothetical protein
VSFLKAPTKIPVEYVSKVWGHHSGAPGVPSGNAMTWIMVPDPKDPDPDRHGPHVIVVFNAPMGAVTRVVLPILRVEATSRGITVVLADGTQYMVLQAPCVCGAGPAGTAYPLMTPNMALTAVAPQVGLDAGWLVASP